MAITYHAGRRIQGLSTYSVAKAWEFSNGRATGSFQMLPTGTSAFTLMVWIKPLNFSSSHTVLRSGSVNDSISFYSNTTGIRWTGSVGTVEIADNTTSGWTHIAIARNGSGTDYLYVNGVASSSTASTGSKTIPSISDWHIGDRHENDEEWGGDMSQWLVYTDQKSLSEIQAVYNSGNGTLSPSTTNLQTHYNFAQTGSTLTDQEGTNNCTASGTIVKEKDGFPSKPTNVQVGSRWEETDTRKMYHYNSPTLTFEHDYSDSIGWIEVGTTSNITGGVWTSNGAGNNADHGFYKALGFTLSDSAWYVEFDIKQTAGGTTVASGIPLFFSAGTAKSLDTSHDALGITATSDGTKPVQAWKNTAGTAGTGSGATTLTHGTQYYGVLIRTSTTNLQLKYYTDSARTSQHGSTVDFTISSGITGLNTIQHRTTDNGSTSSGTSNIIDNVKIYNGVTSLDNVWSELGT
jgi:hypothetical protein